MPKINTKIFDGESIICRSHPMFRKNRMASAEKFPTLAKYGAAESNDFCN